MQLSKQAQLLKRLKYRSQHRGTKEADYLLGRFADQFLASLKPEQLECFDALLNCPDNEIIQWMSGQQSVPVEYEILITKLRSFSMNAH